MHEYYVTEEIIRIACEAAHEHHASKVLEIRIVVGELSGIAPESIQFYFEALAQDTPAAGARLTMARQTVTRMCNGCGHQYEGIDAFACPICGQTGDILQDGRSFYLDSVELPDDE